MITRQPPSEFGKVRERFDTLIATGDIESKIALEDEWSARLEDRTEQVLHHSPQNDPDFDIAAWFALDQDENAEMRGMTECWYG